MLPRSHFQLATASDSSSSPPKPPTPIDYLRQHPKKARITSYETSSWQTVEPYRQVVPSGHYTGHLQHHQHPSQAYPAHHLQQPYLACTTAAPGGISIKTEAASYLPFSTSEYTTPTYTPRESYSRTAAAVAVMHNHDSKHYFQGHTTQAESNTYTDLLPAGVPFSDTDHVSKCEPGLSPHNIFFTQELTLASYSPTGAPRRDNDNMYGHVSPADCFTMSIPPTDTSVEYTPAASVYDPANSDIVPRQISSSSNVQPVHFPEQAMANYKNKMDTKLCAVCDDTAAGFHCGAFVCEACKKFFIRSWKAENNQRYQCTKNETCRITKDTRTHCQRCRYKKCIELKMVPPNIQPPESPDISAIPCRVCGAKSSGFHFGALTCEGCKGFFRRTIHERTNHPYTCSKSGDCVINTQTRNNCKACRFFKCISAGMSKTGSRIGRQPNAIKHSCREEIRVRRLQRQQQQSKMTVESPLPAFPSSPMMSSQDNFRLTPAQGLPPSLHSSQIGEEAALHTDTPEVTSSVCNAPTSLADMDQSSLLTSDSWSIEEFRKYIVAATNPLLRELPRVEVGINDRITKGMDTGEVISRMLKRFHGHTLKFTNYAKLTPDFALIGSKYKILLIQEAMYSITLIQMSLEYDTATGNYNYFDFSTEERDIILRHFPSFKAICEHLRFSGQVINSCNLDEVEMALLCYIEFIRGEKVDAPCNVVEPGVCARLHQRARQALDDYIRTERPDSSLQGDKLSEIQAQLNRMNTEHRQIVNVVRVVAKECNIQIQPLNLYMEIFRLWEELNTDSAPVLGHMAQRMGDNDQREADSTTRDYSSTPDYQMRMCSYVLDADRQPEVSTTHNLGTNENWI